MRTKPGEISRQDAMDAREKVRSKKSWLLFVLATPASWRLIPFDRLFVTADD